jgi:hypothetical protein
MVGVARRCACVGPRPDRCVAPRHIRRPVLRFPPMFAPSQADVRRFFCAAHAKTRAGEPLEALETLAGQWIAEHPEYHADLADVDAALVREYTGEAGQTNPFPAPVHAPVDQRAMLHRPAARHPPGGGTAGAHAAARCTTRTTKPWNAWARCCGKASARAARRMARPTLTLCSAGPQKTEPQKAQSPRKAGFVSFWSALARQRNFFSGTVFRSPSSEPM